MEENDVAIERGVVISSPQKSGTEESTERVVAETGQYLTGWPLAIVTISLCLGTFLVTLDINVIGVAVLKISSVFN